MRKFQDTPAFWRYFGARLKPFTRPLFLGSVGFLSLSGIAIYQYWNNPDWIENQIEQPLEAVLDSTSNSEIIRQVGEENLANVADIDNIDLLLQEINQNQLKNSFNSPVSKKKNSSPDNAFTRFKKNQEDKFKNGNISKSHYLGTKNNALNNLLKPPSLSNYRSNLSTKTSTKINSNGFNSANTPNPIGKLYLSGKNSSLNRTVSSPYTQKSPLSNLGDKSGDFNIRQQRINRGKETNTPENLGNIINQTPLTNPNTRLNQQTNINNFSNRSAPSSSLNRSVNTQNRANNFRTNNVNTYVVPTPNYNRSVPNNYQLQPQSFGQQTPRGFNQGNYRNSFNNLIQRENQLNNNFLSNPLQSQQLDNFYTQDQNQPRQSNNQSVINQFSQPILQPAGSLSPSPLR